MQKTQMDEFTSESVFKKKRDIKREAKFSSKITRDHDTYATKGGPKIIRENPN